MLPQIKLFPKADGGMGQELRGSQPQESQHGGAEVIKGRW